MRIQVDSMPLCVHCIYFDFGSALSQLTQIHIKYNAISQLTHFILADNQVSACAMQYIYCYKYKMTNGLWCWFFRNGPQIRQFNWIEHIKFGIFTNLNQSLDSRQATADMRTVQKWSDSILFNIYSNYIADERWSRYNVCTKFCCSCRHCTIIRILQNASPTINQQISKNFRRIYELQNRIETCASPEFHIWTV